jgi:hypothetical protein
MDVDSDSLNLDVDPDSLNPDVDPDSLNLNMDHDPGFLLNLDSDQAVAEFVSNPDPDKVFYDKIFSKFSCFMRRLQP